MPYARIEITREGVTREHKEALVKGLTELIVKVLNKRPEHIHIVIEEVAEENWGYAGMLTDDYRRAQRDSESNGTA